MEPIATYEEKRLEGRRSFRLYPDRIVVSCRSAAKDYDIPFMLADLSPTVRSVRVRPKVYALGRALLVLSLLLLLVAGMMASAVRTELLVAVPGSLGLLGLIVTLVSFRKVEFACFTTRVGTVAWDVARAGKQVSHFDEFVSLVVASIVKAQEKTSVAYDDLA